MARDADEQRRWCTQPIQNTEHNYGRKHPSIWVFGLYIVHHPTFYVLVFDLLAPSLPLAAMAARHRMFFWGDSVFTLFDVEFATIDPAC